MLFLPLVLLIISQAVSLVCSINTCRNYNKIKDTKLVFAFMVHRHGDRTPIASNLYLIGQKYNLNKINDLIAPWGLGQLTDVGKRTAYKTGEFIRRRYNGLLAPKYNQSDIYIRSTDVARTQMTVLTAMSAVYPAVGITWSDDINWVPVPYTTVPVKYDVNMVIANCPMFQIYYFLQMSRYNKRMAPYDEFIKKVSKIINNDFSRSPMRVAAVYDVILSLISLGFDVGNDVKSVLPGLDAASAVAWDILIGNEKYFALHAGVLLKEFFTYANKIIAGKSTQKVRVYSAHDLNVYALMAISQVKSQGVVRYGSLFSLELRKNVRTGQYFVVPVYLHDPNEGTERYIPVKGCGVLCDFNTFYNMTAKYLLDETSWRKQCGFREDLVVDTIDN